MTHIKPIRSNMTELHKDDGTVVLFSYETPVAACVSFGENNGHGAGYFRTEQKYSVTTSKHITQWLDGVNAKTVPQADIDALC